MPDKWEDRRACCVDQVYVMNGWVRGRVHKRPRSLQIIVQLHRPAKQLFGCCKNSKSTHVLKSPSAAANKSTFNYVLLHTVPLPRRREWRVESSSGGFGCRSSPPSGQAAGARTVLGVRLYLYVRALIALFPPPPYFVPSTVPEICAGLGEHCRKSNHDSE